MIRSFKTYLVLLAALLCAFGAGTMPPVHAQSNAPGTPSSVTVTRGDGTLTATWPAVSGATSYHVTYSADGGYSWSLAAFNHPDANITISSVTNSATYIVAVRARNAHGDSGWRNSPAAGPWPPPILTARRDLTDYSVDLSLANWSGDWWFRINDGTCTSTQSSQVTGIRGYPPGTHDVGAYSDSSCSQQLDQTTFRLSRPYLDADWDFSSDTVTLEISDLTTWWFRINDGTCTQVNGESIEGIAGYQYGEYTVRAYSMSNCSTEVDSTELQVGASLFGAVKLNDYTLTIVLENFIFKDDDWWFRIDNGTCTKASGMAASDIRGYSTGVPLYIHSYADGTCTQFRGDTTYTMPVPEFTATVQADNTVDLDLYVSPWPDNPFDHFPVEWWFRIGNHSCTPAGGRYVRGIAGYQSGMYDVEAFATSNCSAHVASTQFTIP